MDWIKILEVMLTSVSSILVALVGSGFFKKMNDRRESLKSKNLLMSQIQRDEIIHLAIKDIRRRYNSDRVYIWQFHNGGNFYTSYPMQKFSITYERCSNGLEKKSEKFQNQLINNFNSYIKDVMDMKMFYTDINDIEDIGFRSLCSSMGTKSHCALPIYDKQSHLVAILSLDWVWSSIPEEYLKKDGSFTQDFINEITDESKSLDKYLLSSYD
jgi:hypothetical protein